MRKNKEGGKVQAELDFKQTNGSRGGRRETETQANQINSNQIKNNFAMTYTATS
jgi:hypothetical protein